MALLDIQKLSVRFGGNKAVDQVDLRVEEGEIFSVIGPNGAGKTTVFNAVTGLCEATDGTVRFGGKQLRRPLTVTLVLAWLMLGVLVGIVSATVCANVDQLWRAAVKRPQMRDSGFSVASSWRGVVDHFRGALVIEKNPRNGIWSVTAGTGPALATTRSETQAEQMRANLDAVIAMKGAGAIEQRDGRWVIMSDERVLSAHDTEAEAREMVTRLATIGSDRARRGQIIAFAFALGLILGPAGAFAVWSRSRSTPEVIAAGGIARTFQNIRLFPELSVLDNVLVGVDQSSQRGSRVQRARELLAFVGLEQQADRAAKNLPYGERRLLEIARALATNPRLVLLDEPAAGMNGAETADLMELIQRIRGRGVTVLLIEHHMQLVMGISDRVAVLDHGVKIAEGTPAEVRNDPCVIEAYLGKEEVG